MRPFLAPSLALALFAAPLTACNPNTPAPTSAIGVLAGAGGSAVAPAVAKSSVVTTALSVACQNAGPIVDKYAATAFPAAAPFIPAAESAFNSFCKGALPAGTNTTVAAGEINTLFAVVLGTHLMDLI